MTSKPPHPPAGCAAPDDPDAGLRETRVASALVRQGRFLTLMQDTVRLPDGRQASREYLIHPGAAMVIPLFDDGTVLLERQYRYPVGRAMIEFPAGKCDPREDALACGKRELREETGHTAERWDFLTRIHPAISYSTECIDLYLARELQPGAPALDEGEWLETFIAPAGQLLDWARAGRISDVKTLIGVFWLEKILSGAWAPGDAQPARAAQA